MSHRGGRGEDFYRRPSRTHNVRVDREPREATERRGHRSSVGDWVDRAHRCHHRGESDQLLDRGERGDAGPPSLALSMFGTPACQGPSVWAPDTQVSHILVRVLRYAAFELGLSQDDEGFVPVAELVQLQELRLLGTFAGDILRVVATSIGARGPRFEVRDGAGGLVVRTKPRRSSKVSKYRRRKGLQEPRPHRRKVQQETDLWAPADWPGDSGG